MSVKDFLSQLNHMLVDLLQVKDTHDRSKETEGAFSDLQKSLNELKSPTKPPVHSPYCRDTDLQISRDLDIQLELGLISQEALALEAKEAMRKRENDIARFSNELLQKGVTSETADHYARLLQLGEVSPEVLEVHTRHIENIGQPSKISDRTPGVGFTETLQDGSVWYVKESVLPNGTLVYEPQLVKKCEK